MIPTEARSRIAVFIDFDNVEIGVKSTIGGQFDIGLVLEAIKERGEIVTKIAYSDWKRVGDYSRLLTQHAIRMVQRNMTPGGDKNGADITMALDALEMAFTHDHINAFVIVGGDSDFISLVEKLKQYGRRVIVVGGRQFTSLTMQRNCHEFIAYENLVGVQTSHRRQSDRGGRQQPASGGGAPIAQRAAAGAARAQGAVGARGHAAARPAEEHAAAARLHVLGARVRRQQLPRLHGEGGADGRGRTEARRPQHARRGCERRRRHGGGGPARLPRPRQRTCRPLRRRSRPAATGGRPMPKPTPRKTTKRCRRRP